MQAVISEIYFIGGQNNRWHSVNYGLNQLKSEVILSDAFYILKLSF